MMDVPELFVVLAQHPDGREGVMGGQHQGGGVVPYLAATRELLESQIMPFVHQRIQQSGETARVVRYVRAEEVERIEPMPQ